MRRAPVPWRTVRQTGIPCLQTGARTRDTHQKTARSASREALGVCIFFDRRFDTT